jgi:hypothetical protein
VFCLSSRGVDSCVIPDFPPCSHSLAACLAVDGSNVYILGHGSKVHIVNLERSLVGQQYRFRGAAVALHAKDKVRLGMVAANGFIRVAGGATTTLYRLPGFEKVSGTLNESV